MLLSMFPGVAAVSPFALADVADTAKVFAATKLNGDGIPSLLLLRTNSDNQPVAEFCSWQDGSLSVSHRCTLSSTMAELNQGSVVTGKLDQDTPAVFITGINSQGIAVTDILVWQEDADHPSYYEAYDLARRAFARLRRFEREDAEPPVRAVRRDGKENP